MQTFLPYPNFNETARCLDRQRLGKQRVEVKQILTALELNSTSRWRNHPAVKMWKGYETALMIYGDYIIAEWIRRGYKNNMRPFYSGAGPMCIYLADYSLIDMPPWVGDEKFHLSHQSNLVRKNPEYYRKFFPNVPNDLPYVWPTKQGQ